MDGEQTDEIMKSILGFLSFGYKRCFNVRGFNQTGQDGDATLSGAHPHMKSVLSGEFNSLTDYLRLILGPHL